MTKEEFLLDMLNHYSTNPRGISKIIGEGCSYRAGCAIGRHLVGTDDEKIAWDELEGGSGYDDIIHALSENHTEITDIRPDWLKKFSKYFLCDVQALHDSDSNWKSNNKGGNNLTEKGILTLQILISAYNINREMFKEYLQEAK